MPCLALPGLAWPCLVLGPADPQRTFYSDTSNPELQTLNNTSVTTSCEASVGADDKGSYDELTLRQGDDGELAVRYYAARDAFIFYRRPNTMALVQRWSVKCLSTASIAAAHCTSATSQLGTAVPDFNPPAWCEF